MATGFKLRTLTRNALAQAFALDHELFDSIDPVAQKDLRNAAFHCLWVARELDLGREPITTDKL